MEKYKIPLKEALLFMAFQLGFALIFWILSVSRLALVNNMCAVPFSSLIMSMIFKKHAWHINWIKYFISGVLMMSLSLLFYAIEEKFLVGALGNVLGGMVSAVWNFFPGALKLIASVLILLLVLFVSALFFAVFFLIIILSNVVFTIWVLPKFDELVE